MLQDKHVEMVCTLLSRLFGRRNKDLGEEVAKIE
jgi:hypothetical protein